MKIEALTTFLEGRDRFELGDVRTVDDTRGAYFVSNGWAKDITDGVVTTPFVGETDLVVQNVDLATGVTHG
jgi:hypothetical protein